MGDKKERNIYAPVTNRNDRYDELQIVEDGIDPIDDSDEDAVAAIKGHIEKQDWEGRNRYGKQPGTDFTDVEEGTFTNAQCRELE